MLQAKELQRISATAGDSVRYLRQDDENPKIKHKCNSFSLTSRTWVGAAP